MKEAPPAEWIRLFLCREIYRCLPSELMKENPLTILEDLTMLDVEAKVREAETANSEEGL